MSEALDVRAATAALGPVREALLAAAHEEARRTVAAAEESAGAILQEVRDQARADLDAARSEGEAEAAAALAGEAARARRSARGLLLAAQQEAWEAARQAVADAALALQEDPGWPAMRARLRQRAVEVLGPQARVQDVPGGVVAEDAGRRVDLTAPSLALARLEALGADAAEVWSP
ncbi:hypothetical protein [Oryzihumus sp.]